MHLLRFTAFERQERDGTYRGFTGLSKVSGKKYAEGSVRIISPGGEARVVWEFIQACPCVVESSGQETRRSESIKHR